MHIPVLLQEVLYYLDVKPGKRFIDATVGRAGHAREILKAQAKVLGIDFDPSVIPHLMRDPELDSRFRGNDIIAVSGSFADIKRIAEENGFTEVDGILFDLGMGSWQLDDAERGFSFQREGPLDMRYNRSGKNSPFPSLIKEGSRGEFTAADIVNRYPEKDLIRIFYQYGEERRFGKKIARAIVETRKSKPIETTTELFNLIKYGKPINGHATRQTRIGSAPTRPVASAEPSATGVYRHGNTARRIFQALRIEVNQELENLEKALPQALELLKSPLKPINGHATNQKQDRSAPIYRPERSQGGRLVVISFHSLEDRIVKNFFQAQTKNCVCPPSFPVCRCEARATLRVLTKKPVTASNEEILSNPRSKSAKLRAAEKILSTKS